STTVLFTLYAVNVSVGMSRVIGKFIDRQQLVKLGKILLSGGLAVGAFFLTRLIMPSMFEGKILFVVPLLICGVVYVGAMLALGMVKEIASRPGTAENGGK
ncbi:MAG: hypothetical protein ACI4SS_00780, partial [Clostridia bacterium]